jgi:hypothetical protein
MSTSTLTPTFRQVVADVAARAKEKLPQTINGRLEGAIKLVLAHDVTPQADGSIVVGSCTDPLKTYRLVGTACECADFPRAPEGWCRHRIAAGIHKRVRELLPVVPELVEPWADNDLGPLPELEPEAVEVPADPQGPAPPPLPEAPASVNARVIIQGREVQWTLRDLDEARLAVRLEALLARYPVPQAPAQPLSPQLSPQQFNAMAMHRPVAGVCPIHNVSMHLNTKEGRQWWSHRTADGQWCKGR